MADPEVPDVLEALASLPTIAHSTASPEGGSVALYYDVTGRNELHVLDVPDPFREQFCAVEPLSDVRYGVASGVGCREPGGQLSRPVDGSCGPEAGTVFGDDPEARLAGSDGTLE